MPRIRGGEGRNRTGVHGFAGRCITTLPLRLKYYLIERQSFKALSPAEGHRLWLNFSLRQEGIEKISLVPQFFIQA